LIPIRTEKKSDARLHQEFEIIKIDKADEMVDLSAIQEN
jgi:hypothetical protein